MSILIKPYEISVWDDVWEDGKFVEKRIGVIGSDKMMAQCRAIEPNLVRNVNGSKKFSFKMYHKYIDNMTGEETINPFSKWMISERKVKLHYEDKWYDFIIKNINENSSNYLYTYQLEDAIVIELSKNGFGTILDAELQNDMGSAEYLARSVLSETDWEVESEKFVEQVEENLVYAEIDFSQLAGKTVYRLVDSRPDFLKKGVQEVATTQFGTAKKTVLAFYSACKNKPYRFQFIYLDSYAKDQVKINKNNRTIQEKNCQYFIEFWPDEYGTEDANGFIMPEDITILSKTYSDPTVSHQEGNDGTISVWYKGNRYGYAQKAMYSPVLDRYINEYKKLKQGSTTDYDTYYGFVDNEYKSPTLITNLVSNTEFKNTSGWIGASTTGVSADKAIVENVYGRFDGEFISSIDDLKNGITGREDEYNAYMRITLPTKNSIVLNDGLYDHRKQIGNMAKNTEWAFRLSCVDESGNNGIKMPSVRIQEYDYTDGKYIYKSSPFSFEEHPDIVNDEYTIYIVEDQYASKKTFTEQSHIRIALTGPTDQSTPLVYYIKEMEFFGATYKGEGAELITPTNQADTIAEGAIIPTYYYFSEENLNKATSLEDLEDIDTSNTVNTSYLPVFNAGAEKIRSVTVKESNHFNNLQSIAETFECWVDFNITRNELGAITGKKVKLKHYAGKNNYACFRYGVNLKDIQRTYESKNITTKLIVKQNSNELGEDGFCTIQRAGANPTGESCIYDFQYYQNIGLMSADQYIDVLYKMSHNDDKAEGPDQSDIEVTNDSICNIQGYFPRLRELNRKIINENKLAAGIVNDLREKSTQLKIAETTLSSAKEGISEVSEDFLKLTGFYPWEISNKQVTKTFLCEQITDGTEDEIKLTTGLSAYFKASKEEARRTNSIYCADIAELDFSKPTPDDNEGLKIYKDHLYFEVCYATPNITSKKTINVFFYPRIYLGENDTEGRTIEVSIALEFSPDIITSIKNDEGTVNKYSYCARTKYYVLVNFDSPSVQNYLVQYSTYDQEEGEQAKLVDTLKPQVEALTNQYNAYYTNINRWTKQKALLNKEFYKKYSRFIQEGTWIGEEYVDDDKYYADALSVMYNSCYPQVAYSINVLTLSSLPGYEDFVFEVGDKTYAVDPEFFGDEQREEVVITEMSNMLDSPDKDTIKVQNFKNQFQDLFQKITATSQQVQYNAGSYEKGAALAEAISQNSIEFLTQTLDEMTVNLSDPDLESTSTDGSSAIKIIDGKILFGKKKEDGKNEWTVGMSSKGISANKITAGQIDTGVIQIMSGTEPAFRWDAYGISAFGNTDVDGVISGVTTDQFVRFDKYGLYGMEGVDGLSWHATGDGYDMDPLKEIDALATFSLTWQGLKVTGSPNIDGKQGVVRIGRQSVKDGDIIKDYLIKITNKDNKDTFTVDTDGNVTMSGNLDIGSNYVQSDVGDGNYNWLFDKGKGITMWKGPRNDDNKMFSVNSEGAYINGSVYAKNGEIANWTINGNKLQSDEGKGFITTLACPSVLDDGKGEDIGEDYQGNEADVLALKNGNDYPFILRSSGYLKCGNLHATGGSIGNLTISGKLQSDAINIDPTGDIIIEAGVEGTKIILKNAVTTGTKLADIYIDEQTKYTCTVTIKDAAEIIGAFATVKGQGVPTVEFDSNSVTFSGVVIDSSAGKVEVDYRISYKKKTPRDLEKAFRVDKWNNIFIPAYSSNTSLDQILQNFDDRLALLEASNLTSTQNSVII